MLNIKRVKATTRTDVVNLIVDFLMKRVQKFADRSWARVVLVILGRDFKPYSQYYWQLLCILLKIVDRTKVRCLLL